jgi:ribosomal-protein-alanine N-acetyltransferase
VSGLAVRLRDVVDGDYPLFFELHRDAVASRMAAFGTRDADAATLAARWKRGIADGTTTSKAIVRQEVVVGLVASFLSGAEMHVTYWIARSQWGEGIASTALAQFLPLVTVRPLHASTAHDNVASQRVLEKCGFTRRGVEKAFANARGEEIDEVFFELA